MSRKRDYAGAVADFAESIRLGPDTVTRYSAFAWLLATCPDGRYRDGALAVNLAEKACELTEFPNAFSPLLAAAHAEDGNFAEAVSWQRKALDLAPPDEKANMLARMELYEAGKPFHEG